VAVWLFPALIAIDVAGAVVTLNNALVVAVSGAELATSW